MDLKSISNLIELTAPAGGVVEGSPYVIKTRFVVANETKSAGEKFFGIFRDKVVTLPFYGGTVYDGEPAHWWQSDGTVTDYEGYEIGWFVGDYTAADATAEVHLNGSVFPHRKRAAYPLDGGGLPTEISVSMVAGSGTAAVTLPDWVECFEGAISIDGEWKKKKAITLTFTVPGVTTRDVWAASAIETTIDTGVLFTPSVKATTDTLTVTMINDDRDVAGPVARVVTGIIYLLAQREVL